MKKIIYLIQIHKIHMQQYLLILIIAKIITIFLLLFPDVDFVNNITPPVYVPPQEPPQLQPSQLSMHNQAAATSQRPYYGSQVPRNPYFQRFRPSSCEYGWWAPQSSIAPSVFRPRSQKFSSSHNFMYRNFSLNMWCDFLVWIAAFEWK